MTTTATSTGTTSASAATATATSCGATLYDIPTQDASCAIAYGGNHTDIMTTCCKSADVIAYADNCGLYCLAEDQTVTELSTCMTDNGGAYGDVFCRGTGNATATATASATLASGASVIASAGGSDSTGGSSTESGSSSSGTSSSNAARGATPAGMGLTLGGVTVSALVLSSVILGALQI